MVPGESAPRVVHGPGVCVCMVPRGVHGGGVGVPGGDPLDGRYPAGMHSCYPYYSRQ